MFVRLSMSWMLIKQQNTEKNHFCSFNTDLLDLIYTVKTIQCYFTFDYFISVPEYWYNNLKT